MTSVKTNKLRYTNYTGDGDSKSYNDIFQADPYEGIELINQSVLDIFKNVQGLDSEN